jgi:hypothetical protein
MGIGCNETAATMGLVAMIALGRYAISRDE